MRYLPPGRIGDFERSPLSAQLSQAWHDQIKLQIDIYRDLERFIDPLDADDTAVRETIPWTGFPRIYDAWLSIDEKPEQRARRVDRAHRSAEISERFCYVKLRRDGKFYKVPTDLNRGLLLYPEVRGRPSFQDGFSLTHRPQDEYLEWFIVRDPNTNKIKRIDFTSEGPEYWETLAENDGDLAKELYSELLGVNVPKDDLFFQGDTFCPEVTIVNQSLNIVDYVKLFPDESDFKAGQYNRLNKWNTDLGAVHLTQPNNTLFAEINLAARATQRFQIRPNLSANVDRFALTACGGYGALNRNSDPTIGQAINTLALSGFKVMVSNPIGLYIGEVDISGFRDPDGQPVHRDEILTVHRGSFDDEDGLARVLRFSVHPPAGASYGLEQCTLDGFPLTTGGPIARQTTIVIHGIAMPADQGHQLAGCNAKACSHPTKDPQYFLGVSPTERCSGIRNSRWENPPIILAPESPQMIAISEAPRSFGERIS